MLNTVHLWSDNEIKIKEKYLNYVILWNAVIFNNTLKSNNSVNYTHVLFFCFFLNWSSYYPKNCGQFW